MSYLASQYLTRKVDPIIVYLPYRAVVRIVPGHIKVGNYFHALTLIQSLPPPTNRASSPLGTLQSPNGMAQSLA